jgi:hypothetical protein
MLHAGFSFGLLFNTEDGGDYFNQAYAVSFCFLVASLTTLSVSTLYNVIWLMNEEFERIKKDAVLS